MSKPSFKDWSEDFGRSTHTTYKSVRLRGRTVYALLALSCLIPFVLTWLYLGSRSLPWWSDAGDWLKHAHALEADLAIRLGLEDINGVGWKLLPMWEQGAWQYPAFFHLLLSLASRLLDPILSLKLLGALTLSLQPVPAFLLARKMTNSDAAGLLAAYGSSVTPLYIEMVGWGGYPNLLGFVVMGFAFYSILNASENPSLKNLVSAAALSALVGFTHHLTFLIFVGTLSLWTLLLIVWRDDRFHWRGLFVGLGSTVSFFLIYRFTLAWPIQYVTANEAAYYGLRLNPLEALTWAFKEPAPLISGVIIVFATLLAARFALDGRYWTLLISWTAIPYIATLGFLAGVALDYNRMFFFSIQPMIVLMAIPLALLSNRRAELRPPFQRISRMLIKAVPFRVDYRRAAVYFLVVLSFTCCLTTFMAGVKVFGNVDSWYTSRDPYGDRDKLAALEWISENTDARDVFVAEELMARWIEGYSVRRVLMYTDPQFLFVEGQLERYDIASSILMSRYELRNSYIRVLDQTPRYSLIRFWSKGDYQEALILSGTTVIKASLESRPLNNTNFSNSIISEMRRLEDKASIDNLYENSFVKLERSILLSEDATKLVMEFRASPLNSSVTIHNATITITLQDALGTRLIEAGEGWVRVENSLGNILMRIVNGEAVASGDVISVTFDRGGGGVWGMVEVSLESMADAPSSTSKLVAYSRGDLIKNYNVTYIVLPRVEGEGVKSYWFYQHLLDYRGFKIAYVNERVIILRTS